MPSFPGFAKHWESGADEIARERNDIGAGLSLAFRMGVELVVATCIGGGLGYWLDRRWGTLPWLTLVGVAMGNAAGIRNILRLSGQMNRPPDDDN